MVEKKQEDEKELERVRTALTDNGHAYVFIDAKSLPMGPSTEDHVKDHFRAFKPTQVSLHLKSMKLMPGCKQPCRMVHSLW